VTGGKPIAVWSQSITGVSAINPLVAFYDIHGRKGEAYSFEHVTTSSFSDHGRPASDCLRHPTLS
jgi:hypothetical protein